MKDWIYRKEVESLTLKHLDSLWGFAITLSKNKTDAADLVQDTFLRAFHYYDRFEIGTNIKAWLFTIMKNIFINNFRDRQREVFPIEPEEDGEFIQGHAGEVLHHYAHEALPNGRNEIFKKDIQMALQDLPQRLRVAVILKDIEGFNYKEIAEILDCPIGTVMSRLARGRTQLKRSLVAYENVSHLKVENI
ncbi:MAG TPA: sigma-70 family RNA polymerase sigma factor [Nitrospiria bacterium]